MRVDVTMPQMGESIAEGTITRWIKKVGDTVQRDEPLFEITTDKVDAEIPSPAAGTVVEVLRAEGETVPVNEVVAVIETVASEAASTPVRREPKASPEPSEPAVPAAAAPAARDREGKFVSPVVRRIASEHGIDPTTVPGTGAGGRVTKKDIEARIAGGVPAPSSPTPAPPPAAAGPPAFKPGERIVREPMSHMRRKIAEHMIESRRTSAHVHSVFEVDVTRIVALRERYKGIYEAQHGTKLTFTPLFVRAACDGLRAWPIVNASVDGADVVYHKDVNVGIAVALDWGLIVPVIRNADELSIVGLCKRVNDLADRARTRKLNPDEVQSGTFTITNPGVYGGLFGLPIISQPQVAILGIGGIRKRPVVIDDAIAIRSMMYMAMSYDHRVVDGAVADQFLARVQKYLENFDEGLL